MMFNMIWDEKAYEKLKKLEPFLAKRILKKVKEISENPLSKNIKRLKGETAFRLRIGDYRIIFEIEKDKIIILNLGHRKNIYG